MEPPLIMMESKYLFDTDILIDYLRGKKEAVNFLDNIDDPIYISVINIAELYAGVKDEKEEIILEEFIQAFNIVSVNKYIAQKGGLYRQKYGKSHGVGLADAIIAASSEVVGAILVSLNKKHFPMIENLLVPYIKP